MTDNLYTRSLVRGINAGLIASGHVVYPSKTAADQAADFVAKKLGSYDPTANPELFTEKVASDVATELVACSQELCKRAGGYLPELSKTAASAAPAEVARFDSYQLIKTALEAVETPNNLEQAAKLSPVASFELSQRPDGYANTGVGNYEDKGKGALGTEEKRERPNSPTGTNSATQETHEEKAASLAAKVAASYAGSPGVAPNTATEAAKHTESAKADNAARPAGYANVGVSASKEGVPAGAVVGHEQKHSRPNSPSGSNTATKAASDARLQKIASRALPFLFENLKESEKVAHVRALAKLGSFGQANYLGQAYGAYGLSKEDAIKHASAYLKIAEDACDAGDAEMPSDDADVAAALDDAAKEIAMAEEHEKAEMAAKAASVSPESALRSLHAAISQIAR